MKKNLLIVSALLFYLNSSYATIYAADTLKVPIVTLSSCDSIDTKRINVTWLAKVKKVNTPKKKLKNIILLTKKDLHFGKPIKRLII